MSMIKINLVNGSRSIPLARGSTAGVAIKAILDRLDIPEQCAKYCCLMYVVPQTYGLPLVDEDLIPEELFFYTNLSTSNTDISSFPYLSFSA